MKFTTNAKCMGCIAAIKKALAGVAPAEDWEFDLSTDDKVMTYVGSCQLSEEMVSKVERLAESAGFRVKRIL